jgi:hypothetical protein
VNRKIMVTERGFLVRLLLRIHAAVAPRAVGLRWKYSHLKRNGEDVLDELSRLRLLDRREPLNPTRASPPLRGAASLCGRLAVVLAFLRAVGLGLSPSRFCVW